MPCTSAVDDGWTKGRAMSDTVGSSSAVGETTSPRAMEILDNATGLFDAHGYANVGMRAIADAIGIRPASLYHHFDSKEAILYAISLHVTKQFVADMEAVIDPSGDPQIVLKQMLHRQIVSSWDNRAAIEVTRRDMRELEPEHLTEVLFHRARYRKILQSHIERGIAAGDFFHINPKLASLAILSLVNGVNDWFRDEGLVRDSSRTKMTISDVADQYAEMIVDGLLARRH